MKLNFAAKFVILDRLMQTNREGFFMYIPHYQILGFARVTADLRMKSELHTPLMNCYPNSISGCFHCDTVYINEMGMSFVEKNYPVATDRNWFRN